ncbi:MAG: ABC transporter permease subunit, partial [Variovorax sp.]
MVSAVFHSPLDAVAPAAAAEHAQATPAATAAARKSPEAKARRPLDLRRFWMRLLAPLAGFALLALIWELIAARSGGTFPGPWETWLQAVKVFVGIPAGFAIGRFEFLARMFNPLISLLRPVSPLAWLPIGLLVFKGANPAAIWTIFICSIWPMVINTAVGVQRVPSDYMNVAKVLNLSEWKIITKILFPAVLPYMLTGVRLAVGTAWLVIVAAEMLTGGVGIGFWVWDEWNNLNV